MKKIDYSLKNSSKNDFLTNLILVVVSAIIIFVTAKILNKSELIGQVSIIAYAFAIAIAFCKTVVEAVEKLMMKKLDVNLITTAAILVIFASQHFEMAAIVAVVYSFCKCVADLVCSDFSDKILSESGELLYYNRICENSAKPVALSKLNIDDKVKVKKGEYIAFDYKTDDGKNYKSGYFTLFDEAEVTVCNICDYEIDFSVMGCGLSKTEKKLNKLVYIYLTAVVLIAFFMFAKAIIDKKTLFESLYFLGVYLLFANPLSLNSGISTAVAFKLQSLKDKGIFLKNSESVEKLSNARRVIFDENIAKEGDSLNNNAVKAVRIAEILKLETAVCAKENSAVNKLIGFDECLENEEEFSSKKSVYIGERQVAENDNLICLTVNEADYNHIEKSALSELVKECRLTKQIKFFEMFRVLFAVAVNLIMIIAFSLNSVSSTISNLAIEWSAIDIESVKVKVAEALVSNNALSPWIIAGVHLVLIISFLFISMVFINKKKK